MSPLAAIQAFRSSGVTCVSGSPTALARMSTTQSGTTRFSTGISATDCPSAEKCSGASTWVPVCSLTRSSNRLKPFSAILNFRSRNSCWSPKKVGKSSVNSWVRSSTDPCPCASAAGAAPKVAAATVAAPAPRNRSRRLSIRAFTSFIRQVVHIR